MRQTLLFKSFFFLLSVFISNAASTQQSTVQGPKPAGDYLLVLSSQRNAETIAEAARMFSIKHATLQSDSDPAMPIVARTDSQLSELNHAERETLIRNSRAVLGVGLFGASVAKLMPILAAPNSDGQSQPRLIMNSDHRLIALSQMHGKRIMANKKVLKTLSKSLPGENFHTTVAEQLARFPDQSAWIRARSYWGAGGVDNTAKLFEWLFSLTGEPLTPQAAEPTAQLRWLVGGAMHNELGAKQLSMLNAQQPIIAIIDHAGGARPADARLLRALCKQALSDHDMQCMAALAYWGEAGVQATKALSAVKQQLAAVIMLQDFVIGGGEGRQAATEALQSLNVPVLKAIKLRDRSAMQWQFSSDGLAYDKVYYQVAMPELQGASQPLIIATAGAPHNDPLTGIRMQGVVAEPTGISTVLNRVARWQSLQRKHNKHKRVAIIYYNHPPGRHNIGADNLDVPASLWEILQALKSDGYNTGKLPATQAELLDMMQADGVNLPQDAQALAQMHQRIETLTTDEYQAWFKQLPIAVQQEMKDGPFGLLHAQITAAIQAGDKHLAEQSLHHTIEEMHHLLEGVDHPARVRALALLEKLEHCYEVAIMQQAKRACLADAPDIIAALRKTGIEGLSGWGDAPGQVMVKGRDFLLPGIQFGNVFIGPQPPRGWEINEELLHANLAFPPPHQYLAFYYFLSKKFNADALIHLGRHSTYEFLPKRAVGLASDDYSRIIAGDIPGIYPYIVDGVGEGIQAKRRGLAVMVDHLTPPLASTPLYDELLQLRQLVESFEASHGSHNSALTKRLIDQIRNKVDSLELKNELAEAMSAELAIMGIGFDEVDDDMFVHEVGHYLTDLQERFMPLGLHIFGKDWQPRGVDMMLDSMLKRSLDDISQAVDNSKITAPVVDRDTLKQRLEASPSAEMDSLLNGLNGGFVEPGQGNDPIRSPASLPTGRNFYALDSSLIPSRVAWQIGREMAQTARRDNPQSTGKSEAVILWASDVVRDEGVMIAFGLDMLGLEPIWNSRGLVKGLKHQALSDDKSRTRRDIVFTTSGLFRDLYAQQMMLLDRAVLMALDASSDLIRKDYPALTLALSEALSPLGKQAQGGNEALAVNKVAAHWVERARTLMAAGWSKTDAGVAAAMRIFGDAPGSYGAGINRLVERSGAWQKREQLAQVYMRRIGHNYGLNAYGKPAQKQFEHQLAQVENTYFGRSSNLYGLIDNNDAFDYLGGLSLAIESLTGSPPNNFVLDHADPNNIKTRPLGLALRQELRGRFLNPEWLKAQMAHDYAGARTMGSEFLEYLWGWQVTNPTLVGDWAWQEVKAVYMDDRYQIGVDSFLEQGHNVQVKSNMLAVMLVAIQKQFWQASPETTAELAEQFATLVAQHGLPGSGHTNPNNPMLPWLEQHLSGEQWQALAETIALAKGPNTASEQSEVHRLTEIQLAEDSAIAANVAMQENQNADLNKPASSQAALTATESANDHQAQNNAAGQGRDTAWVWWLAVIGLLAITAGFYRGVYRSHATHNFHKHNTNANTEGQ